GSRHLDLIGTALKSDVLSDLFETYEIDVVYRYDRIHENQPDQYVAEVPQLGLEFLFDSQQRLSTLFIEDTEINGFNPFEGDPVGLPRFGSKGDAITHAKRNAIELSEGRANFLGIIRDWVRFEHEKYSVHYEFVDSKLEKITVQARHA
ncbi:hypothetical protein XP95_21070, partial [Xanthomonas perforans]